MFSILSDVLITLLFSTCMIGLGRVLYGRWMQQLDAFAELGVAGILGLGTVGLITLPIGLLPEGLHWGVFLVWVLAAVGVWGLLKKKSIHPFFSRKATQTERLIGLGVGIVLALCVFEALLGVMTPSTATDWDTLAYHLAVPKLWLQAGHIYPITFIHHSNFPLSVDNLYIWGLSWGDQYGAKAFQLSFYLLGILSVFGFTRQRYGVRAAAWAVVGFATVPVILWEAGTGYIDVAHGLYTAWGVLLMVIALFPSSEGSAILNTQDLALPNRQDTRYNTQDIRSPWPLAALCLGFAAGSKYTGLQAFIAIALVFGAYLLFTKNAKPIKTLAATLAVAAVVCSPWYIKNVLWVGNPVYPFFYEVFGGKNWDKYNADIYRHQQQIFGVPREGPAGGIAAFPHAVLGLAYQPGRYTDPQPELVVQGNRASGARGFPFQAMGAPLLAAGLVWLLSGKTRRFEGLILGWIGLSFLMWFVLSQQSRYAISFAPLLAMLLGGGVIRLRAGPLLALATVVQAAFTLWMLFTVQGAAQMVALTNSEEATDYLAKREPFIDAAEYMNDQLKGGKVALYDQVHGFYLDIPYFWANPGHTTEIGYSKFMPDGKAFADRLRHMGFTHVYVDVSQEPRPVHTRVGEALGMGGHVAPYTEDEKRAFMSDPGQKYKWLLSDAAAKGELLPVREFRSGFLLKLK